MKEQKQQEELEKKKKDSEVYIINTWGTGANRDSLSFHIKKSYYQKLGWQIGDSFIVETDFNKKTITLKRIDLKKIREV